MQRVDPFIPRRRPHRPPDGPYRPQRPRATSQPTAPQQSSAPGVHHPRRPRLVDSFVAQPATPRTPPRSVHPPDRSIARPLAQTRRRQAAGTPDKPATAAKQSRWWLSVGQLLVIVIVAVSIGFFFADLLFGELVIAAYGVFAVIRRLPSRNSFLLALIALVATVLLLLIHGGDNQLSDTFAVYTFLLMVVGTVSLGLEVRRESV